MNELLIQGLYISLIAMGLTFAALGVFILIIIVLQRIFPPKLGGTEEEKTPEPVIIASAGTDNTANSSGEEEAVVAAIAAAIRILKARQTVRKGSLGQGLETGHSAWWKPALR
jgi:sodium pump decarboxylase gamma subunit